jgi:hypothetical protein
MEEQAFIHRRRGQEPKSCCSLLPQTGRGRMMVVARCGGEDLILGPHWFMLICTFLIVIGLSVVIYGVVLNHRADVSVGAPEVTARPHWPPLCTPQMPLMTLHGRIVCAWRANSGRCFALFNQRLLTSRRRASALRGWC